MAVRDQRIHGHVIEQVRECFRNSLQGTYSSELRSQTCRLRRIESRRMVHGGWRQLYGVDYSNFGPENCGNMGI